MIAIPDFSRTLPALLKSETRPIYLYGTGDGADKILSVLSLWNISPAGIFVSEDFFRGQTFHEYACTTLSRLDEELGTDCFVVLIAFGSHLPAMIDRVKEIARTHTVYIPDVPVAGTTLFDHRFASDHAAELSEVEALWADDMSRELFRSVIRYKLNGAPDELFSHVSEKDEVFRSLIPLSSDESYLDIGAYNGDTVSEFLHETRGQYRTICAMEPDPKTFRKLQKNTEGLSRLTLLNAAAGDETHTEELIAARGRGTKRAAAAVDLSGNHTAGHTVTIRFQKIDELDLTPSYVKIDVEGAEKEALAGMKQTLQRCRPKLNIALYHRSEDLFVLPLLLRSWLPGYRFYLRRHNCFPCWELNLYGRPEE